MDPVKIKICGITNIEDARAAAEAGADALGFMFFEQSPRNVQIEIAAQITRSVSPFVLKIGVFVNPTPDLVQSAIAHCDLNLLQFHGEETSEFCQQFGMMTMKAFRVKDAESLDVLPAYRTDAFLLDSYVAGKQGGTGEKFNWDLAVAAKQFGRPVFLAGGLNAGNVRQAIEQVRPFGIDVSSGVESAPGKKDHQKIRDFISAARTAC
ncbi:MAG: phosphoribosylanthranilate isomerase [Verrucomicrobia bacterium]|nr:phosphoribosylanthranilate isomerase [Verrucomicrobiota bacterium]